jgi:hypothetical protein
MWAQTIVADVATSAIVYRPSFVAKFRKMAKADGALFVFHFHFPIEGAVFPVGQYHARIAKVALPRPPRDGGKSLFRHRQVHDPAQIEAVGRGL